MNNLLIPTSRLLSMKYLLVMLLILGTIPAFAESDLESSKLSDSSKYELKIDEHEFIISYQVNADVLAMAIDKELNSLLIGLENTDDSIMIIELDHDLINARNNEFAVLVNGFEVDYDIVEGVDSTTLSFFVPVFTEEVEIIGTYVIPEFPFGPIIALSLILPLVMLLSKTKLSFRL